MEDDRLNEYDIFNMDLLCVYFRMNYFFEIKLMSMDKEKNGKLRRIFVLVCVIFFLKVFWILEKLLYEFWGYIDEILDFSWLKNVSEYIYGIENICMVCMVNF